MGHEATVEEQDPLPMDMDQPSGVLQRRIVIDVEVQHMAVVEDIVKLLEIQLSYLATNSLIDVRLPEKE